MTSPTANEFVAYSYFAPLPACNRPDSHLCVSAHWRVLLHLLLLPSTFCSFIISSTPRSGETWRRIPPTSSQETSKVRIPPRPTQIPLYTASISTNRLVTQRYSAVGLWNVVRGGFLGLSPLRLSDPNQARARGEELGDLLIGFGPASAFLRPTYTSLSVLLVLS